MPSPPLLDPPPEEDLAPLLAAVSRTFYFSLRVLPASIRPLFSVAYLVARAADTLADEARIPAAHRRELLDALGEVLHGARSASSLTALVETHALSNTGTAFTSAERANLAALELCLSRVAAWDADDRRRTVDLLGALLGGMQRDVARFPSASASQNNIAPPALPSLDALDRHLYDAAGCVGEWWTRTLAAHDPTLAALGEPEAIGRAVHLGKALQLVNVIRDLRADLAAGRCYVPAPLLARHGMGAGELGTASGERVRPILDELRALALAHVDSAWPWVHLIPARALRLRLACVWPLWIALGTLAASAEQEGPIALSPRPRITRPALYATLAEATLLAPAPALLERAHRRRRARAAARLDEIPNDASALPASAEAWR